MTTEQKLRETWKNLAGLLVMARPSLREDQEVVVMYHTQQIADYWLDIRREELTALRDEVIILRGRSIKEMVDFLKGWEYACDHIILKINTLLQ